jgi:hypothetical protein
MSELSSLRSQLEYWNTGMMLRSQLEYWNTGMMARPGATFMKGSVVIRRCTKHMPEIKATANQVWARE